MKGVEGSKRGKGLAIPIRRECLWARVSISVLCWRARLSKVREWSWLRVRVRALCCCDSVMISLFCDCTNSAMSVL